MALNARVLARSVCLLHSASLGASPELELENGSDVDRFCSDELHIHNGDGSCRGCSGYLAANDFAGLDLSRKCVPVPRANRQAGLADARMLDDRSQRDLGIRSTR